MVSARTKAEQAQDAARKAAADAEVALSTARQYSPASSQPGVTTDYLSTSHTCTVADSGEVRDASHSDVEEFSARGNYRHNLNFFSEIIMR